MGHTREGNAAARSADWWQAVRMHETARAQLRVRLCFCPRPSLSLSLAVARSLALAVALALMQSLAPIATLGGNLLGMLGQGAGENGNIISAISGLVGGGAIGGLMGRGGDAASAGDAAAGGSFNPKQIIGGLAGGAGAGALGSGVLGMLGM